MVLSKFRRIVSGSLAAVMLVSAGAAAFAKDEKMPTEISGTYQFREIGTLRDLVDEMAEPVLKSIAQHLNSGNNDPNAMSKVIETMLRNDLAHNEANKDRMRTDLFYFNEDWFKGDATDEKPNWDMAVMSMQFCSAVWHNTESDSRAFLERLGFRNVSFYDSDNAETDSRGTRLAIAAKPLADGTTLVTVVPEESVSLASWVDNLDIGSRDTDDIYHGGFRKAAQFARQCLNEYMKDVSGDVKYWITGYSRGGAISNRLSAILTDESGAAQKDVFTYTFACPNTVELTEPDTGHNNIHNYVSDNDLVTAVPSLVVSDGMKIDGTESGDGLTFRRYGIDHSLQGVDGVEETDILEYLHALTPATCEDFRVDGMASDFAEMEVVIPESVSVDVRGTAGMIVDSVIEEFKSQIQESQDVSGIIAAIDNIAGLLGGEAAGLLKDLVGQLKGIADPSQIDEQKLTVLMTSVYRVLESLSENDVSGLTRKVENSPTQAEYVHDTSKKMQAAIVQLLSSILAIRNGTDEDSELKMSNIRAMIQQIATQISVQKGITIPLEDYEKILNAEDAESYRDLFDRIYRLLEAISQSLSDLAESKGTDKQTVMRELASGLQKGLEETTHNVISLLTETKTDEEGKTVFTNRAKQNQKDLAAAILIIFLASRTQKEIDAETNSNEELVKNLTAIAVGEASDVRAVDEDNYEPMDSKGCLSRVIYNVLNAAGVVRPSADGNGYVNIDEEMSVEIAEKVCGSVLRLIRNNRLYIGEIFDPGTESGSRRAAQLKDLLNGAQTIAHNIKRIVYAHYHEVYLSWLKADAATDENSFYHGGVAAPMNELKAGAETKFALLGNAKYDAAFALTGADDQSVSISRSSYDNAAAAAPGTIDIADINAAKSSTESSTLLDKDVVAGSVLSMNGNLSVKKDTSPMENGLTCSETTMKAEGELALLFNRLIKGYVQIKANDVTGTVANNGSETVWNAYRTVRTTYKDDPGKESELMLADTAKAVNTRVHEDKNTTVTVSKTFVGGEEQKDKTVTQWDVTDGGSVSSYRAGYDKDGNVSNVCATLSFVIPEDAKALSVSMNNKTQWLMGEPPAFGIDKVNIGDGIIRSVELRGVPEPSVIYAAVYDSAGALKAVKMIDVADETSYSIDKELIEGGSYKVFLWDTDMKPIDIVR